MPHTDIGIIVLAKLFRFVGNLH